MLSSYDRQKLQVGIDRIKGSSYGDVLVTEDMPHMHAGTDSLPDEPTSPSPYTVEDFQRTINPNI